jgi:hypothetical protein
MDPVHRIELPSGDARSPCLCYISPHISLNLSSFPQTVELVEHCRHSCGLVLQIIDSFSIFPAMRNSMLVHISKAYTIRLYLGIYPCGVVREMRQFTARWPPNKTDHRYNAATVSQKRGKLFITATAAAGILCSLCIFASQIERQSPHVFANFRNTDYRK